MIRYEEHPAKTVAVLCCDICEAPSLRLRKCPGCNCDICSDCGISWLYYPFDGEDTGDYPPLACKPCDDLAVEYGEKTRALIKECDERVGLITAEWKAKCNKSPIETK